MKVLTVALLKGGSGKTTTSLALAAVLAEHGRSVVLVDADPQATATMTFGLQPVAEPWSAEPIELFVKELWGGSLTLVRGGRPLQLAGSRQREMFFARATDADLMIIDTAPGEIELVVSALRRSDLLLIPVEPSPLSLTGMLDVAELAKDSSHPVSSARYSPARIGCGMPPARWRSESSGCSRVHCARLWSRRTRAWSTLRTSAFQ